MGPVKTLLEKLALLALPQVISADAETLWFSQPANDMHDAIPIGNGRLGAMIYGIIGQENITLNEDSVWSGVFTDRVNPQSTEALPQVRELLDNGDYVGANQAYLDGLVGTPAGQRAYQPAGQLSIMTGHYLDDGGIYNRTLNVASGVASTFYESEGVLYSREAIANFPTGVLAFRFSGDGSTVSLNTEVSPSVVCDTTPSARSRVTLRGKGTEDDSACTFSSALRVKTDSGDIAVDGNTLVITDADSVELFYDTETLFQYPDGSYEDVALEKLDAAASQEFSNLRSEAIDDFTDLYNRVSLFFEDPNPEQGSKATDERLAGIKETGTFEDDPRLLQLAYNFGRYLLISSSRPGSLPANLQGIWNDAFEPPWDSKYTININIQMHYWQADANNIPEVLEPLWDHLQRMQERGSAVASEMYGCGGWVCHHNTDIWGDCAPQDALVPSTAWPMGAVWLVNQAMDHFRVTQDAAFANDTALPLAKGAIDFIYDFAVLDGDYYVIYPSNSPELAYDIPGGDLTQGLSRNTQMNRALLHDLFSSFIDVSEAVGSSEGVNAASEFLSRVGPPTVSAETGRLLEWEENFQEVEAGHRHFSSIYGLYPGRQYSPMVGNKTVFNAAHALLEYRMEHGSGSTGWSRVWAGLLRARSFEGDVALQDAHELLVVHTSPNLFSDAHGAIQMDATFGIVSQMNEMFLQSHNGMVHLGPAIPSTAVSTGEFRGWVARGSFTVDARWEDGDIVWASVTSRAGGRLALRIQDARDFFVDGEPYSGPITTQGGQTFEITF